MCIGEEDTRHFCRSNECRAPSVSCDCSGTRCRYFTGGTYAHSYERCYCSGATSLNWVQDGWAHLVVCLACVEMDDGDTVVCW